MTKPKGPVLIDLDATEPKTVANKGKDPIGPDCAPPVPDVDLEPAGRAMQTVVNLGTRPPSRLARWFWRLLWALLTFGLSLWAWDTLTGLIARNTYLGYAALGLTGAFLLVCLGLILREWAAFARLRRVDGIRAQADTALASGDLGAARQVRERLIQLYSGRAELEWARRRVADLQGEVLDADGHLALVETEFMAPLDAAAMREIETAARQVATVTAIVPLALADVATALTANIHMIRRIAEVYGGRAGTFGSWRLMRTVLTHLVATGAVAIGDDLIGSVAGGGVVSKLSRRFGEGIVNGALTARVGVAAQEVCRPLPFRVQNRPSVTGLVKRALTGLFGTP